MAYTYRNLLKEGESILTEAGIKEAKVDAWLLFQGATGLDRTMYLVQGNDSVPTDAEDNFFDRIRRRKEREPVQYIEKKASFMGYDFVVNGSVLIPRMDTEILVSETLKTAKKMSSGHIPNESGGRPHIRILDMCTGSGCIIISLYLELTRQGYEVEAVASDVSEEALAVARENAARLQAEVKFVHGNLFENVKGRYDIIVSNPPYIPTKVIDELEPEVREHEPRLALDGTEDGLYFYREITAHALEHLKAGGALLYEIGYEQGRQVSELCNRRGMIGVRIIQDLAGLDRVVAAYIG